MHIIKTTDKVIKTGLQVSNYFPIRSHYKNYENNGSAERDACPDVCCKTERPHGRRVVFKGCTRDLAEAGKLKHKTNNSAESNSRLKLRSEESLPLLINRDRRHETVEKGNIVF